jgi:hypothetical protein
VPLRATGLNQPALQVNGATLRFPVEVPSGGWIEANGPDDCTVYGPKGEPLGKVVPEGAWPTLPPGANAFEFGSTEAAGPSPRARITVFSRGPAVAPVAAAPAR